MKSTSGNKLFRRETRHRHQHVVLAHDQAGRVQRSQLKAMPMRNRIRRAGLDTVAAENTAVVVDVVGLRVAFAGRNPLLFRILCCLNKDAVRRAGRRAQKTGYALLEAIFVALQLVRTSKTRFKHGST